jgi:catalase
MSSKKPDTAQSDRAPSESVGGSVPMVPPPALPRTSGQATPFDPPPSPPQDTDKTFDLRPETMAPGPELTTNQGVTVSDDQNSLKSHVRGPTLLEDILMREKVTHFDHERIPERVVHARGTAAHGFFQVYESQAALTMAAPFQDPQVQTPVFVRFSTVAGSRVASPSNSTPRMGSGTWWATTCRCSSSRTRTSSRI